MYQYLTLGRGSNRLPGFYAPRFVLLFASFLWQSLSVLGSEPNFASVLTLVSADRPPPDLYQRATYGQKVVAAVLVAEAANEGKGMVAVAEVIRNRADALNLSPLAVVKQKSQFSCLNRTQPERLLAKMRHHPQFPTALQIARVTYNQPENLPGLAQGANHYHATWIQKPSWARNKRPVALIGNHAFYRF